MKIELKLYDVETLLYTLDKAIFYQKARCHDVSHLEHIKKIMEMQVEAYKENVIAELKKKYRAGNQLSVVSLQRQEGLGYSHAAQFCEQAKAEAERDRINYEFRKEEA